jgi:hypothetical protein
LVVIRVPKNEQKDFIAQQQIKARAFDNFQDLADNVDAVLYCIAQWITLWASDVFLVTTKTCFSGKTPCFYFCPSFSIARSAMKNKVILMEAFKVIHAPQYSFLDDFVKKYAPFAATFSTNKYSSRMPDVKNGIFKSVFDEHLGKGATYDMLVYPVELAISLFGPVKVVKAMSIKLLNGVSHTNAVLLQHHSGIVTNIMCSKSAHGVSASEILSDEGTLSFDEVLKLNNIKLYDVAEQKEFFLFDDDKNNMMQYELNVFVKMILEDDLQLSDYLLKMSCETVRVLQLVNEEK